MTNLTLNLKKEYFDQIASGEKAEEYRLVNYYWNVRLKDREYDNIIICCGYPKRDDSSRRIIRRWNGFTIKRITHPHFGGDPVYVYAIDVSQEVTE